MFFADLHLHSYFSRATSRDCDLPHLEFWARRKGLSLLGTGDLLHPAWRETLRQQLVPDGSGLYALRPEFRLPAPAPEGTVRFLPAGEVCCIYRQDGACRRVHHLLILPDLSAADRLAQRLAPFGKLSSDGRPILSLSSRDLLALLLETSPASELIPAHIWTPHFSMMGAFTAFSSPNACFGDLTHYIHALETGLSSDPAMNRQVPALDPYNLVSSSDAHSPAKLAREATVFETELSFPAVLRALRTGEGLAGTVEYFPQMGKYHLDGHRSCGVCLTPRQTREVSGVCPVCGKKLTLGVAHRILDLSGPTADPPDAPAFRAVAPLPEVMAACLGLSPDSRKLPPLYENALRRLGPELAILTQVPPAELETALGPVLAEGILRMRQGRVSLDSGYDGKFGTLRLFSPQELNAFQNAGLH